MVCGTLLHAPCRTRPVMTKATTRLVYNAVWIYASGHACNNEVGLYKIILPFSCFVLLLVNADGNHLAVPNGIKSKWLNAKIIVTQSWYNSIERFFQFYSLLFLEWDASLTGLFLFDFKTTHYKNYFDT